MPPEKLPHSPGNAPPATAGGEHHDDAAGAHGRGAAPRESEPWGKCPECGFEWRVRPPTPEPFPVLCRRDNPTFNVECRCGRTFEIDRATMKVIAPLTLDERVASLETDMLERLRKYEEQKRIDDESLDEIDDAVTRAMEILGAREGESLVAAAERAIVGVDPKLIESYRAYREGNFDDRDAAAVELADAVLEAAGKKP